MYAGSIRTEYGKGGAEICFVIATKGLLNVD
jgi:hypothetical protein